MTVVRLGNTYIESNGQIDDALILITSYKIVNEISIENGLEDTGYEWNHYYLVPMVDPVQDIEKAI